MSVADILEQLAANAGRAPLARGALIANTIASAAAVPGQVLADRERVRQQQLQEARQNEQLGFQRADQAMQQQTYAAAATKEQKAEQERQDRGAIMAAGLDPANPTKWNFEPAVLEAMKRGRADVAHELIDAHNKTTEFDPAKGATNAAGEVVRQPVAKPVVPTVASLDAEQQRILAKPEAERTPEEVASAAAYNARRTPPRIPGPGSVHDTANGLVRIGEDNTVTPLGVQGYHPPTAAGAAGGLDPDAVAYTATQYRILGPQGIPTRIGEADKTHILNEAAKQAKALGQSPAQAVQKQAAYKSDGAALTKMTTMASSAEAFETKAIAQADLVRSLSNKVSRAEWPLINGALLSGKEMTGDTDTHLFANGLLTFTTEYAKLMEGSTGSAAGSSEGARRDAAKLISTALKKGTIEKTLDQMQWEMRQTREGYRATIDHITTRMGGAPAAAPTAAPAAAPSPTLAASATHRVVQNGVTYDVTTDAAGKVISAKPVQP